MRDPLAWGGLWAWLGVLAWEIWQPPASHLLLGVVFMAALALAGRQHHGAALAWLAGAFLLGSAAAAIQPSPQVLPSQASLQGVVLSTSGRSVRAQTTAGPLTLRFAEAPPVGTRFAAWTTAGNPPPQLPGSFGTPTPYRAVRR